MDNVLLAKFAAGEWKPSKTQCKDMASELIKLRDLIDSIRYGIDKANGFTQPDSIDLNHAKYLMRV